MTEKQYAAIYLKVPRSGDAEIDAMIRESRRADFAGQAMAGMANVYKIFIGDDVAKEARSRADSMLAELEKEAKAE
jgi:hypothetical protein